MWEAIINGIIKLISSMFEFAKSGRRIQNVVTIYDNLNIILNETDAQRATVCKIHNGGGIIKPGADIYVSVVMEDYKSPLDSVKAVYQRLQIDQTYARTLAEIFDKKKAFFVIDQMPECMLKNLYARSGIKFGTMLYLKQTRKEFYFLNITTTIRDNYIQQRKQQAVIDTCVSNIKNVL